MVATITGETVSAQTVSKLTRDLDEAVRQFHQALSDDYVYLFLDGVSLRVRRPTGRKPGANAGGVWHPARRPAGTCWPFCAARARGKRIGKHCWGICIGAG